MDSFSPSALVVVAASFIIGIVIAMEVVAGAL